MNWRDWPALSADYASHHQTVGNRRSHLVGIPLIVYAVVYWTRWPSGNPVPLAAVFLPVYFLWDWRLGLGMTAVTGLFAVLAAFLPPWTAAAAFIVGWILQFAGHKIYEKKSPAFTRSIVHLLVGPVWILREAFSR